MKTMLNQILRKLMRHSSAIGKVYTGTKLVEAVPSKNMSTKAISVTVPAGTYVVTGNVEWGISEPNAETAYSMIAGSVTLAVFRGNMSSGGGDCCSAIVTVTKETELSVYVYHGLSINASLGFVSLKAVRIK